MALGAAFARLSVAVALDRFINITRTLRSCQAFGRYCFDRWYIWPLGIFKGECGCWGENILGISIDRNSLNVPVIA